jgi:hypothetical protein
MWFWGLKYAVLQAGCYHPGIEVDQAAYFVYMNWKGNRPEKDEG